jgi:glycosyltransferase involved in cell wall biosynthesis
VTRCARPQTNHKENAVTGRVTVMVPSYNYAQYLTACVESAADQAEADVAIVDNGSTDDSPAVGASLAERYPNVRFVRHEHNEGIIASFNRCRDEVRGDYALLLCADDLLAPGSLARAVAQLDAHPHVGLLYGTAVDFSDPSDVHLEPTAADPGTPIVHDGGSWVERLCRTGYNPIRTPEALFRSSVFAAAGPYEAACPFTSDLNLWLRIAARSDVLYLRGPVQAMFRQHEDNAGKDFPHNSIAEMEQRWTAYELFLATLPRDERRPLWEELARRRLASEARYSASRAFVGATPDEAEALLALADRLEPAPAAERAGWAVRRRLGPDRAQWFPGFHVRPVVHRAQRMRADQRRARRGIG